jgi:hypothetical protein
MGQAGETPAVPAPSRHSSLSGSTQHSSFGLISTSSKGDHAQRCFDGIGIEGGQMFHDAWLKSGALAAQPYEVAVLRQVARRARNHHDLARNFGPFGQLNPQSNVES